MFIRNQNLIHVLGDVIIQNGANSMVGLSVVQLAAAKGVKTINIIRRRYLLASVMHTTPYTGLDLTTTS